MKKIEIKREIILKAEMPAYREMTDAAERLTEALRGSKLYPSVYDERDVSRARERLEEARSAWRTVSAESKITALLDGLQKGCSARTICLETLCEHLHGIERRLEVSKAALEGTEVHGDINAQRLPGAYKYTAESTQFTAVFRRGEWRITALERDELRQHDWRCDVVLTDACKAAILERYQRI